MPRFVILQHDHPRGRHWDFMLESGTSLITWALSDFPTKDVVMEAERLPDHRIAYLDYEGPVSNDRGDVVRVEAGKYDILCFDDQSYRLRIMGASLKGIVQIIQSESARNLRWYFEWKPEEKAESDAESNKR